MSVASSFLIRGFLYFVTWAWVAAVSIALSRSLRMVQYRRWGRAFFRVCCARAGVPRGVLVV